MAHNTRLRLDAAWAFGPTVSGADMNTLDVALAKAVNGTGGGTWSPAASIVIGGTAGMWFGGPVTLSNAASVLTSAGKHIVHGTNDYIYLGGGGHTGSTRTIDTPPVGYATQGATGSDQTFFAPTGRIGNTGFANPVPAQPTGTRFLTPLAVHHGSTLTSATLTFRVNDNHTTTGVPDSLVAFRIISVDVNGNILLLSSSTIAGYDGSVSFTPRPANAAGWYAANAAQTIVATCDQNNVCDTSKYTYWVEVFDETGANCYQAALLGNTFHSVACTFTNIADMRPQ